MKYLRVKVDESIYSQIKQVAEKDERSVQYVLSKVLSKAFPSKHKKPSKSSSIPVITADQVTIFNLKPEHRVSYEIQEAWLKLYKDKVWIQEEIDKANNWLILNKHRARRSNFGMYFNTWLNKSWNKYRVTLKPNEDHKSTYHIDQMKRLERGEL